MSRTATLAGIGAATAASVWLHATALSQTPNRSFDAARKLDRSMVTIPNWRFFAPTPAMHDNRVAYRVLFGNDEVSPWFDLYVPQDRRWFHCLLYPPRRRDKGITDLCQILLEQVSQDLRAAEHGVGYRMLCEVVRATVVRDNGADPRGVQGFQFLLARDAGYAEDEDPDLYYASKFEPLAPPDADTPAAPRTRA